jgi:hypothetical protein
MTVNRVTGVTIDTTFTQFHRYLLVTVAGGWTVTRFKATAKWIFAQSSDVNTYVATADWSHSLSVGLHGGTEPPLPSNGPTDPSIMEFDLAEPEGLERIFWAPNTAAMNIVATFTKTIEWRGQMHLAAQNDFYYMKDNNGQTGSASSQITIAWSLWYG